MMSTYEPCEVCKQRSVAAWNHPDYEAIRQQAIEDCKEACIRVAEEVLRNTYINREAEYMTGFITAVKRMEVK